ncbi:MAG: Na+/H+ antiporter NhaA [Gammaproteobacteria bacterium]|nr:Na+/H+ antiporter NhaA [Gammaproteobacteria bacterium]
MGVVMWVTILKSGIQATLVGIILAMFIPMPSKTDTNYSPLKRMQRDLHSLVAFFLPLFAFANAGVNFTGVGTEQVFHNVPLGITPGLIIGKQVDVFRFCWLAIKI